MDVQHIFMFLDANIVYPNNKDNSSLGFFVDKHFSVSIIRSLASFSMCSWDAELCSDLIMKTGNRKSDCLENTTKQFFVAMTSTGIVMSTFLK